MQSINKRQVSIHSFFKKNKRKHENRPGQLQFLFLKKNIKKGKKHNKSCENKPQYFSPITLHIQIVDFLWKFLVHYSVVLTSYWNDCEYGGWMWIEVMNCYEILLEILLKSWVELYLYICINYLILPLYEWWIIWFECIISYKILFVIAIVCGVKSEYVCAC